MNIVNHLAKARKIFIFLVLFLGIFMLLKYFWGKPEKFDNSSLIVLYNKDKKEIKSKNINDINDSTKKQEQKQEIELLPKIKFR
jgi:regulatory protein YycI of two-component signal transduction system YycFG